MKIFKSFRNLAFLAAGVLAAGFAFAQGQFIVTTLVGTEIFSFNAGTYENGITAANLKTYMTQGGNTATIASGACGATTNGAVAGTSQVGKITIGAAATTTCTVGFGATLAAAPKSCTLTPGNVAAVDTATTGAYVSSITTAHFVITGLALANTIYYYTCN